MPGSSHHFLSTLCSLLGQVKPAKPRDIHTVWWMWVGLVLLGVLLVLIVMAITRRHRLAVATSVRPERPRAIKDAWVEAGKRAEPIPEERLDDSDEGDQ